MSRITLLVATLVMLSTDYVAAQRPGRLQRGARVRVWAPGLGIHKQGGALVRLDSDSVVLYRRRLLAIPRDSVTRLDVSLGTSIAPVKRGAASGAILGGLGGLVVCGAFADRVGSCLVLIGGAGAGAGALTGALIGSVVAAVRGERWRRAYLQSDTNVSVVPLGNGTVGLGLSVAF